MEMNWLTAICLHRLSKNFSLDSKSDKIGTKVVLDLLVNYRT